MRKALLYCQGYTCIPIVKGITDYQQRKTKKAWLTILMFTMPFFVIAQSVTTDKFDYLPGETAYASGTDWPAYAEITLTVHEDPVAQTVPHDDVITYTSADASGNFWNVAIYHFDETDLGNSFTLTATDQYGNIAVAYFTDQGGPNLSKLEQWGNGQLGPPPITPTGWVTGNVVPSKAHYSEATTLPYRVEAIDLTAGVIYNIVFGWDTQKNGKHALDFLTSYDLDRNHDLFGHSREPIDILGGTSLDGLTVGIDYNKDSAYIPTPTQLGGNALALADFNSIDANFREINMYGGTILSVSYVLEEPLLSGASTKSQLKVQFMANRVTVVMAWGANIASQAVWGAGMSASAIIGSPYHMETVNCTGPDPNNSDDDLDGCGNKEVQLSASAVEAPPTCDVQGPVVSCAGEELIFTAVTDGDAYLWKIINNGTGASISGPDNGPIVTLDAGTTAGSFEVELTVFKTVTGGTIKSTCSSVVDVNPLPVCDISGAGSVCPGETGLVYTGPAGMDSYKWTISGSGTIVGSTTSQSVTVDAGGTCDTDFTLVLNVTKGGCANTCDLTVDIEDDTPPTITAPANVAFECEMGEVGMATATDNCDELPAITYADVEDLDECGLGIITRTWTATDECGNSSTAVQLITIKDDRPPVVYAPADVTFDCEIGDAGTATAIDDCDDTPDITFSDVRSLDECGLGTITRTWKAEDCRGNFSTAVQTITIKDDRPPVVIAAVDKYLLCNEDIVFDYPSITDNCDSDPNVSFVTVESLDVCGNGTITRTWTVADCAGNFATASQTITIDDCGYVELTKLTDGVINTTMPWSFTLHVGGYGVDPTPITETSSAGLFFATIGALNTTSYHTVCEVGVDPAWTVEWYWDLDGDGIAEEPIPHTPGGVYNPNGFNEDNSTYCVDFGAGTSFPMTTNPAVSCTFAFKVDNHYPGGEARTPGYWKNWNSCSGGNQAAVMDEYLNIPGIWLGDFKVPASEEIITITKNNKSIERSGCEVARLILDQRELFSGKKMANDAAYTLAMSLLAFELNQAAGTYRCAAAEQASEDAHALLSSISYDGTGDYLRSNEDEYSLALELANTLDLYNNNDESLDCSVSASRIADASKSIEDELDPTTEIMITAYPNPFRTESTIEFSVPFDTRASLDIYTLDGRHVTNLFDKEVYAHEKHSVLFDASSLPANMYLYKLCTDQGMRYGKLIPQGR